MTKITEFFNWSANRLGLAPKSLFIAVAIYMLIGLVLFFVFETNLFKSETKYLRRVPVQVVRLDVSSANTLGGVRHYFHLFVTDKTRQFHHHFLVSAEQYARLNLEDTVYIAVYEKRGAFLYKFDEQSLPLSCEQMTWDEPCLFEDDDFQESFEEEIKQLEAKKVLSEEERTQLIKEI